MWFKMKLKWRSAMWCLLQILIFARVSICKKDFFMTHNMPNPQNVVQWSFYSVFSERRFMGHTVILQYLNIQEAASRSTCYYVFRKSSLLRCCKPRHVTKQDLLQFKNSKKLKSSLHGFQNHSLLGFKHPSLDFRCLLCMDLKNLHSMDLKILLSLDFSILLWISKVFFFGFQKYSLHGFQNPSLLGFQILLCMDFKSLLVMVIKFKFS